MLIQHVLKLLFGFALKSDKLQPVPIILLPSDDRESDNDRRAGTGQLNMQAEMRADGKPHAGIKLAPADGEIC